MSLFSTSFNKEKALKTAEKYVQQGKIDAAIPEYKKILEAESSDLKIVSILGELYVRNNQSKEAIPLFSRIAEHLQRTNQKAQALAMFRRVYKMDPNNYSVAVSLAEMCKAQGQTADAVQFFLSAGGASRRNNQIPTAIKMFKEALKLDPKHSRAKVELAGVLQQSGESEEAHDLFIQAGQEMLQKQQYPEALETYRKAMVAKPGSRPALKAITDFSLQQGDAKGAVRMLQQLLFSSPNDVDLLVLIGRTCLTAKLFDDAEEYFTRLVELDPIRYEYLLEVARQSVKTGDFERPVAVIEKCADLVLEKGQKKKLTAILKEIIQKEPNSLPALRMLADIYHRVNEKRNLTATLNLIVEVASRQGLKEDATRALRRLIAIAPKKKNYQDQLSKLDASSSTETTSPQKAEEEEPDTEDMLDQYNYSTELLETIVKQNPMFALAKIKMLEDMVAQQPDYIEARLQLKQQYLENNLLEKAALTCLELVTLYRNRANPAAAEAAQAEAYRLNPALQETSKFVPISTSTPSVQPTRNLFGPTDSMDSMEIQLPLLEVPSTGATGKVIHNLGFSWKVTEVYNSTQFQAFFGKTWLNPAYATSPISLIKIGVDHFGDDVITSEDVRRTYLFPIAEVLEDELRSPAFSLAYGGNAEFLAILPQVDTEQAAFISEMMRGRIESLWLPHPNSEVLDWITSSFGVATAIPSRSSPAIVMTQLNATLNHARQQGGNQVAVYTPPK